VINGSVDISSIHDIEIRAQGGLDIFTSAHHLHYWELLGQTDRATA
jgi:hypothetical protein